MTAPRPLGGEGPGARYYLRTEIADWRLADRSSACLLPPADLHLKAVVRVFSARPVSWRGFVASDSWIAVKEAGDRSYRRFDHTAWSMPIWMDRSVPDGRLPEAVLAADGAKAERLLPRSAFRRSP